MAMLGFVPIDGVSERQSQVQFLADAGGWEEEEIHAGTRRGWAGVEWQYLYELNSNSTLSVVPR
jgi:hypothetical protein